MLRFARNMLLGLSCLGLASAGVLAIGEGYSPHVLQAYNSEPADYSAISYLDFSYDGWDWNTEDTNFRYVGQFECGEDVNPPLFQFGYMYTLRRVYLSFDGTPEITSFVWDMFSVSAPNGYISKQEYNSFLFDSATNKYLSDVWFCLYVNSFVPSGYDNLYFDFYNFCPRPMWANNNATNLDTASIGLVTDSVSIFREEGQYYGAHLSDFGLVLFDPNGVYTDSPCWRYLQSQVETRLALLQDSDGGYSVGYDAGYNKGYADGKTVGYDNAGRDYDTGYAAGYSAGRSSITDTGQGIANLFGVIVDVPLNVLNGLAPLAVWNIPLISIVVSFLFIGIVLYIVRKFI